VAGLRPALRDFCKGCNIRKLAELTTWFCRRWWWWWCYMGFWRSLCNLGHMVFVHQTVQTAQASQT
jgi:hypothetical protein